MEHINEDDLPGLFENIEQHLRRAAACCSPSRPSSTGTTRPGRSARHRQAPGMVGGPVRPARLPGRGSPLVREGRLAPGLGAMPVRLARGRRDGLPRRADARGRVERRAATRAAGWRPWPEVPRVARRPSLPTGPAPPEPAAESPSFQPDHRSRCDMEILVTGATGFVGMPCLRTPREAGTSGRPPRVPELRPHPARFAGSVR